MVEGKHKHHLTTIIHMVQTMWRIRYGCGLVEWEHFYNERSGSSGGVEKGKEGDAEEFTCRFTNVLENSVLYRFSHSCFQGNNLGSVGVNTNGIDLR